MKKSVNPHINKMFWSTFLCLGKTQAIVIIFLVDNFRFVSQKKPNTNTLGCCSSYSCGLTPVGPAFNVLPLLCVWSLHALPVLLWRSLQFSNTFHKHAKLNWRCQSSVSVIGVCSLQWDCSSPLVIPEPNKPAWNKRAWKKEGWNFV